MKDKMKNNFKNDRLHICTSGLCNNNCLFCGDRDPISGKFTSDCLFKPRSGKTYLTPGVFRKECLQAGTSKRMLFTSGEPTLNPHLLSFISLARERGYCDIAVQTNGRMLSYKRFCKKLLDSGVQEISISLHGHSAPVHNALTRTAGSFDETVRGLKNILSLKKRFATKLIVTYTVTKLNYTKIGNFMKWMLALKGIDGVVFNTLMYTGRAERFAQQLFVSYEQIVAEFKRAVDKLRINIGVVPNFCISPIPFCLMKGYEHFVGHFEEPLQFKNEKIEKLSRDSDQKHVRDCKKCIHLDKCDAFNSSYLERKKVEKTP